MWDFLFGYLFGSATGISRFVRPVLWLLLIGLIVAALIYSGVVLTAVRERSHASHVPAYRPN